MPKMPRIDQNASKAEPKSMHKNILNDIFVILFLYLLRSIFYVPGILCLLAILRDFGLGWFFECGVETVRGGV